MLSDNIEALVLSGELFNPSSSNSRPSSPHDSDHSNNDEEDKGWHDEELKNKLASDTNLPASGNPNTNPSIGMGPGRTGVKGVIRDEQESRALESAQRRKEIEEMNKKMEKANLGGKTYLEEERERARSILKQGGDIEKAGIDPLILRELSSQRQTREKERGDRERTDVFGRAKEGRFGHLREVGVHNFVSAVEKEARGVWVVVHLYEPSLDRCFVLDDTLAQLARVYPDTKFLRCRAKALGFASSPSSKPLKTKGGFNRPLRRLREDDDEDELGLDEPPSPYQDEPDPYSDEDDDSVDTDVLPTVLVYRDGELVHNWVRVDWEAAREGAGGGGWEAGVEELLEKHGILPNKKIATSIFSNLGLASDGEDDD
ncbi:hypothetical protein VKT23_018104, partial [Stygiomarasmius scandens]